MPNWSVGVSYLQGLCEMGECMSYMRIQAALDYNLTMEDAYDIVDETLASVEVYEIGTPFLRDHRGLKCVRAMRANYPGITLYVDTKIEDIGLKETMNLNTGLVSDPYDAAASAFEAGGDIVTIMANSSNRAIEQTVLGVTLENIGEIAKARPSLICIGRGIYAAEDRRAAAAAFKAILDEEELSW